MEGANAMAEWDAMVQALIISTGGCISGITLITPRTFIGCCCLTATGGLIKYLIDASPETHWEK